MAREELFVSHWSIWSIREIRINGFRGPARCSLLLRHEWISVIGGGRERLLDCARTHPAHEIQLRSRLVVRSGASRAAERLLADHRARRLVVDVEVSGGISQRECGLVHRTAIVREDRAGQ